MSEKKLEKNTLSHSLHEECGVFGMYDLDGNDVASTIYYGLFALQHRGQESCGIAVSDTCGPKGKVTVHKDMGLVNEVFTQDILDSMKGDIGVGHVRYSTAGASTRENAQPLVLNYVKGTLGPDNDRFRGHCLSYRKGTPQFENGGGSGKTCG